MVNRMIKNINKYQLLLLAIAFNLMICNATYANNNLENIENNVIQSDYDYQNNIQNSKDTSEKKEHPTIIGSWYKLITLDWGSLSENDVYNLAISSSAIAVIYWITRTNKKISSTANKETSSRINQHPTLRRPFQPISFEPIANQLTQDFYTREFPLLISQYPSNSGAYYLVLAQAHAKLQAKIAVSEIEHTIRQQQLMLQHDILYHQLEPFRPLNFAPIAHAARQRLQHAMDQQFNKRNTSAQSHIGGAKALLEQELSALETQYMVLQQYAEIEHNKVLTQLNT